MAIYFPVDDLTILSGKSPNSRDFPGGVNDQPLGAVPGGWIIVRVAYGLIVPVFYRLCRK